MKIFSGQCIAEQYEVKCTAWQCIAEQCDVKFIAVLCIAGQFELKFFFGGAVYCRAIGSEL